MKWLEIEHCLRHNVLLCQIQKPINYASLPMVQNYRSSYGFVGDLLLQMQCNAIHTFLFTFAIVPSNVRFVRLQLLLFFEMADNEVACLFYEDCYHHERNAKGHTEINKYRRIRTHINTRLFLFSSFVPISWALLLEKKVSNLKSESKD